MAPMYREGVTNPRDWASILQYPAPWGEIGGGKLVIASPASSLRKVQNPAAVVNYWDRVRNLCYTATPSLLCQVHSLNPLPLPAASVHCETHACSR